MADLPTGSSSTSSDSSDIFMAPSGDVWVEPTVRPPPASEPPFKLPRKNIGYFSPSVPTSVPGWRDYRPYTSPGAIPAGRDPVGWNCDKCYFKYSYDGKKLCNKHRFEIPTGAWRCDNYTSDVSKFSPFVKEQTPFANDTVLPLVDQQGRYLVDIYKFVTVRPEKSVLFANGYHNHNSPTQVPFFVLGPSQFRFSSGSWTTFLPTNPQNFMPVYRYFSYSAGVGFPMSTKEKPGWIQYDIDPVTSDFKNLRFFPKPDQDLDFLQIGSPEGHVVMYNRNEVERFEQFGYSGLSNYIPYLFDFRAFASWRSIGPELIFAFGDDLVSSKPSLIAVGEKSVPITIDKKIFLADKVSPVPVKRDKIAVSEVSTGLLGIPREEKALNLFEDINKIGIDPSRWNVVKKYNFSSAEPEGWYNSYGLRDNSDEQLPPGSLTYQTALSVESDEANAGINLVCRTPVSSFPWRDVPGYGFSAWERANGAWTDPTVSFPAYGVPRKSVSSMVELTSRQYFAYQPGRITGFTFGVRACSPELVGTLSEVQWGIENDTDAMYFRLNNGTFSVCRSRFNFKNSFTYKWSTSRLEQVDQGSFNGDNLNGFGDTNYVMEWNKVTMFKIEYGWYGGVGARLYAYVPVGNKFAKWTRIHNFGPPQSDNEPFTPTDLKNRRYPTLNTPWFKVFYRIISANGAVNDQGPLSLSKYGVSVYMDGGNLNSPQITDVSGQSKIIVPFNKVALNNDLDVSEKDVFPILAFKYKPKIKKRLTQDSISDLSQSSGLARTETTNYKVIVPKKLSIVATPTSVTATNIPIKVDLWLGESVSDNSATKGKTFSYPDGFNYSITNPFVDPRNPKIINWPTNSDPWWTLVPPVALTPDWRSSPTSSPLNLPEESPYRPIRPNLSDMSKRRYLLGNDPGDGRVYLRGGVVSGVNPSVDPNFWATRVFDAGTDAPDDALASFKSPYNYTLNNLLDSQAIFSSGNKLDFKHLDMVMVSDPIFESLFAFSYELSGPVYVGLYYHKPSLSTPGVGASQIATSANWLAMLESEISNGMWPLFFSPYSLHGSYGLFSENSSEPGGFAHLDQSYEATKYVADNTVLGFKYNTSRTKVVGPDFRGYGGRDFVDNPNGYGVHFVFLLGPGGTVKNPTITANPNSSDLQKYSMRFLGQPDSLYAGSSANTFLSKIYGKSLVGTNVEFPTKSSTQSSYDYIKSLPGLSTSPSFKWGRPNINVQVKESSNRSPVSFRDYSENSGILIDNEATQKLDTANFQLQASFFITADKSQIAFPEKKLISFDLSNFFSYNGNAIRGPGDFTFFVTARNISAVEDGGVPVEIMASLQCEEG